MRINEVEAVMRSTYMDWSSFLANPRWVRRGSIITWTDRVPRMLKHPVMASDITTLVDDGQYTFQIGKDGSVIQIYYAYDKNGTLLEAARLAFYSIVLDNKLIDAYNLAIGIANVLDYVDINQYDNQISIDSLSEYEEQASDIRNGPVSWFRIEYDPQATRGVLHHDCHLHFSAFPHSRFVVAGIPSPSQFIEFIMAFCYPEDYRMHRLNEHGNYINAEKIASVNGICFPQVEDIVFSQIAHFRIPVSINKRRR